jgi:hypothetical protein
MLLLSKIGIIKCPVSDCSGFDLLLLYACNRICAEILSIDGGGDGGGMYIVNDETRYIKYAPGQPGTDCRTTLWRWSR